VKIRSALIRVYSAAVRHLGTREGEREGLPATIRDIGLSHCQPWYSWVGSNYRPPVPQ